MFFLAKSIVYCKQ